MTRKATIERTTKETSITVQIDLDGTGATSIDTGIGFFDHMLEAFGRHGLFDLDVKAKGDLHVDGHHTVEDTGIVLGQAVAQALGDKRGIVRYGDIALPMDEALVMAALDISGRGGLYWEMDVPYQMVGSFDSTLAKEFFIAFATNAAPATDGGRKRAPRAGSRLQGMRPRPARRRRRRPARVRRAALHKRHPVMCKRGQTPFTHVWKENV